MCFLHPRKKKHALEPLSTITPTIPFVFRNEHRIDEKYTEGKGRVLGAACETVSATNTLILSQEALSKLSACGTLILEKNAG